MIAFFRQKYVLILNFKLTVTNICFVAFWTSDQHVDARESRIKQDYKDFKILPEILELKNPINNASNFVFSLGTGITSD